MELISPTELAKEKIQTVQDYVLFCLHAVANLFRKPLYIIDIVRQADTIGVGSLPIVVLTGFFTGAVLAVQAANTLERFGSITLVGQLVSLSMVPAEILPAWRANWVPWWSRNRSMPCAPWVRTR
jgi:phospholipid/cholesterol/gamma-HCH transport system permease protein